MTAADRLKQLSKLAGVSAAVMLLTIGTGATAGEALVNYSGLSTGTATEHILGEMQQGGEGISSNGGLTSWDGKKYPLPSEVKPLGHERIYFDDTHARRVIEKVKKAKPEQEQQLFSEAENVIEQLQSEIIKLDALSVEMQTMGRRAEMIRVQLAIEQMKAQIEEVDAVFVMFMMVTTLH